MTPLTPKQIKVFFSYSHKDEELRDTLAEHLAMLRREGIISEWHDRKITGGSDINSSISENLNDADIILLLISSSFLASDYCYDKEVKMAIERHKTEEARVIPVILRPSDWNKAPFGNFLALPKDAVPVTKWTNIDDAFLDIAKGIRKVAEELRLPSVLPISLLPEIKKRSLKVKVPLPFPVVNFVPRYDEFGKNLLEKTRRSFIESDNRTVVLWGSGGVGKTTLAVQIAKTSEDEKQVIWIDLDNRPNVSLNALLDEIATQIGQPEFRLLPPSIKYGEITSALSEVESLIILDNFETLKPEYQAECLDFLKKPEFDSLITTRERIENVKNLNIFEMSEIEANEFLDRMVMDSALPNVFGSEIRQKIMETAERNALLMQWIVGQIDSAQSPNEVFEELKQGEGDAAERIFDRSFNLPQLGRDGRSILLALSLFAQSARRKSVRGVVGIGKDHQIFKKALKKLVNLRLVSIAVDGERLFLNGLTRQFAKAHLQKSNSFKLYNQKFINFFAGFARTHDKITAIDLNLLEEEKVNILTAIDIALDTEDSKNVFSMCFNILEFLDIRGYYDEALRYITKALDLAKKLSDRKSEYLFNNLIGVIYSSQGEIETAEKFYKEALNISEKINHLHGIATATGSLANIFMIKGEIDQAESLYNKSLEICRKLNDSIGVAKSLSNLANVLADKGKIDEAENLYKEGFEISKKLNDFSSTANNLRNRGILVEGKGEIIKAEEYYNKSLEIYVQLGEKTGIAASISSLGSMSLSRGDISNAESLSTKSLEISYQINSPMLIIRNLSSFFNICLLRGNTKEAEQLRSEILNLSKKLCSQSQDASNLHNYSRLLLHKHEITQAKKVVDDALYIYTLLNKVFGICDVKTSLAEIMIFEQDFNGAEELCNENLMINTEIQYVSGINENRRLLGRIFQHKTDFLLAENYYQQSLSGFRQLEYKIETALTLKEYSSLAKQQGDIPKAIEMLKECLEIFEQTEYYKAPEVREELANLEKM